MVAPFLLLTPAFFGMFTLFLTALLPAALVLGRARGYDLRHAALTAVSTGLILALTVPAPGPFASVPQAVGFLRDFADPGAILTALRDVGNSEERQANVLLYIPAAAFAALMARRFVPVAVAFSGLSWCIELTQAISGVRAGTLPDWVYNSAGAVIGAGLAYVWHLLPSAPAPPRLGDRQPL